jgi:hypothetical protein
MLNNIAAITNSVAPPEVGDYESIQTFTAGSGGSATITFSSIAATYKHLQLRFIAAGTSLPALYININSDFAGNYTRHRLQGNGTTASADGNTPITEVRIFGSPGLPAASTFAAGIVDILDYSNTNKYKTVRALAGVDNNGSGNIELMSSLWQNTAAITTLTIAASSGNLSQYSSFALYGIK